MPSSTATNARLKTGKELLDQMCCKKGFSRSPTEDAFICQGCGKSLPGEHFDRERMHWMLHPGVMLRDCTAPECQVRYVMES